MLKQDLTQDLKRDFEQADHYLKGKNEKVIGLMKDELGGQIIKEFVRLRAKTDSYLKDNNDEDKKAKTKKVCQKKQKTHGVHCLKED